MSNVNPLREVTVDSEELSNFLFQELTKRGFIPSDDEVEEIADVVFDYLIEKSIIRED